MLAVKTFSPLLDLRQQFDIVYDMPPEEFHLLYEGLTKMMLQRMLTQSRYAKHVQAKATALYRNMKVFSETPRFPRKLNPGDLKGSEFAVILYSLFPSLAMDILEDKTDEW